MMHNSKHPSILYMLMVVFVSCTWICADENAYTICYLRDKQRTASYYTFHECEEHIASIKREAGATTEDHKQDVWLAAKGCIHAIPWIVWQVLALLAFGVVCFLLPYVFHLRYLGIFICAVVLAAGLGCVVWYGYEREAQPQGVICLHTCPVYLGPGDAYPVYFYASYLDEVFCEEAFDAWIKIRYANTPGWVKQEYIQSLRK